jgi:trimeric autotransporter adhesin
MPSGIACFIILISISSTATAQQRTELVAGSKWLFPGLAGPIAALEAPLGAPNSLAVASNGDLLIADWANNLVLRLASDGTLRVIAGNGIQGLSGDGGPATAASVNPASIALDHDGNLYIADFLQETLGAEPICRIRKLDPNGTISTVALACVAPRSGFTVDPAGNPVVADEHYVRRYNGDGSVTVIAGSGNDAYQCGADGTPNPSAIGDGGLATAAAISPGVIVYDSAGNLYIGETIHPRIRKVNSNGVITTVAGLGCSGIESPDGSAAATATIGYAGGFAVDPSGALYFLEGAGVRRIANGILDTALNQTLDRRDTRKNHSGRKPVVVFVQDRSPPIDL